jgi:type III restriction enzyme
MHKVLDKAQESFKTQIESRRKAVMTVDGKTVVADMKGRSKSFEEFWEAADMAVIDDAYRRAARIFSPDISRTYVDALAYRVANPDEAEDFEEALIEARVSVAALGMVTEVQISFDAEADKLAKDLLAKHKTAIKGLSHDRQESYRQVREMSAEPQDVDLVKPETRFEPTKVRENEVERPIPTYKHHLLSDGEGNFPAELNAWEQKVVETEMKREGFSFWYRNPQQPGQSSLGIAYIENELFGIVRPDFIFFVTQRDGAVLADIVDPHGLHLKDASPKLKGLALFAATHANAFRRIESIAEAMGKLRVLDLTNEDVRKAIADASDATALFSGVLASDYY